MSRHELWVELTDEPGNLARLAGDLAACGANVVDIEVRAGAEGTVLDRIVVDVPDGRERALEVVATGYLASYREVDPSSAS